MKKVAKGAIIIFFVLLIYITFTESYKTDKEYEEAINAVSAQLEAQPRIYPYFKQLSVEDKVVYAKIYHAAKDMSTAEIRIYTAETESEINDYIDKLMYIYREIVYENPEFFWLDPYRLNTTTIKNGDYYLNIQLNYMFSAEQTENMKTEFEDKLDDIVSLAQEEHDIFEQVLFVHDYIVSGCDYDKEASENGDFTGTSINAYGCLIDGNAICSGYAMAFNAVMKQLGYETGVEFNTYDEFALFDEGHVWNYCKLDGEYYYFDLTWDDISPDEEMYEHIEYYHTYFAITEDELSLSHTSLSDKARTPDCDGTKYNYFRYNNLNFSKYNFSTVKTAILSQADEEYIQLRFDTYSELLAAESDLLTDGRIFDLFPDAERVQYYMSNSKLHMYIIVE